MDQTIIEKVSIGNPIGNLYRKSHVLILVQDEEGSFVLGKKKDFIPVISQECLGVESKMGKSRLSRPSERFSKSWGLKSFYLILWRLVA